MWRREAPRARRRPISPVRSITDTSVTLAIPIAPISNAPPPSSKKQIEIGLDRLPDSFWLGGSSHHEQARLVGPESERDLFGDPGSSLRFGSPPSRAQDRSAGKDVGRFVRFDHVVHAIGFGFAGLAFSDALGRRAPLALMGGLGFGALNEMVEFLITRVVPDTNIGGFENTGWDLVANAVGAILAALWVRFRVS